MCSHSQVGTRYFVTLFLKAFPKIQLYKSTASSTRNGVLSDTLATDSGKLSNSLSQAEFLLQNAV